jgi:YegS/Rv2252/BmrU family lipid kinase
VIQAHVIVNPAAGRGAALKIKDTVARAFRNQGWVVDVVLTERPGHASELACAAAGNGAQRVIAVGGDGLVHEVANGLLAAGSDAQLGVVPVGSGNDFAKLAGVFGQAPERAVARLVTAAPQRFDVGRVGNEWFVNSLGLGFGPAVVKLRNDTAARLKGFASYLVPILRAFASFAPPRCELHAAEFNETGYMMMVEVCNGTTAGGSYRFAPEAQPTDGLLDVCLVRKVSLPRFLIAIPRVIRGTHAGMREVTIFRTRELRLRTPDKPIVLHMDGELREPGGQECVVKLEPQRLNVMVAR